MSDERSSAAQRGAGPWASASFVPTGLSAIARSWRPTVETVGYFQGSLRDQRFIRVAERSGQCLLQCTDGQYPPHARRFPRSHHSTDCGEVRFALAREVAAAPAGSANGFAGSPALEGIAPFLALAATIAGPIDATTGMLINIKVVDKVLRDHAVDFLRASHYVAHRPVTLALGGLFPQLASRLLPHGLEALALSPSPFLTFCVHCKEPHMVRTTQRFEFSAAHRLHAAGLSEKENQEVFGRCTNPNGHGHNYELEVILAGEPDAATGQILPGGIPELQQLVNRHIIDVFDHKHLNLDCAEFKAGGGGEGSTRPWKTSPG